MQVLLCLGSFASSFSLSSCLSFISSHSVFRHVSPPSPPLSLCLSYFISTPVTYFSCLFSFVVVVVFVLSVSLHSLSSSLSLLCSSSCLPISSFPHFSLHLIFSCVSFNVFPPYISPLTTSISYTLSYIFIFFYFHLCCLQFSSHVLFFVLCASPHFLYTALCFPSSPFFPLLSFFTPIFS